MNVVLIGYRGTGKTSVAQQLAQRVGWSWVDTDAEIQRAAGTTIAELFAAQGEQAFRELESRIIAQVAQREQTIVATGGGAVLRDDNRLRLRACGRVVWLRAAPETIFLRLQNDHRTSEQRPALTPLGQREEIQRLVELREPLYRQCADLIVDTDQRCVAEVVEHILQAASAWFAPWSAPPGR
jgi:shikimate kinase